MPRGEYSGLRVPERRREAEQLEQRARWSEQLQPGERDDLRREHQRQDEAETNALRARTSVSDDEERDDSSEQRCEQVPPSAVTRLCRVAVQVVGLARTLAQASVESSARARGLDREPRERQHATEHERRRRPAPKAAALRRARRRRAALASPL